MRLDKRPWMRRPTPTSRCHHATRPRMLAEMAFVCPFELRAYISLHLDAVPWGYWGSPGVIGLAGCAARRLSTTVI